MSYSSGTFSINTSGQPVVTGTVISSSVFNALTADLATGLTTCVLKDGTQTITANIPMAGFRFTGLGAGSALAESASITQVQDLYGSYLTGAAGTNTITVTATPTPAYAVGQRFWFIPANTNTGPVTLNISSVGAGAVQLNGAALTGGEIPASLPTAVMVTATTPVFEIVQPTQGFPDALALVFGSTDYTKKIRFEADTITTGTTRVATMLDADFSIGAATQAQQETGTATTVSVTPGRQQFHQSAAKAWVEYASDGSITAGYNVASVTDNGAGNLSPVWGTAFSAATYSLVVSCLAAHAGTGATSFAAQILSIGTSGCNIATYRQSDFAQTDVTQVMAAAYGDQ